MNLLLPSIGRKVDLAKRLRAAVRPRGGRLFGSDIRDYAPALALVDHRVQLPGFDTPGFWAAVGNAIARFNIDAIVPVRDGELAGWAAYAESGQCRASVLISDESTLRTCHDKSLLYACAESAGIPVPAWVRIDPAMPSPGLAFPLLIKPVCGSGSRGVHEVQNAQALAAIASTLTEPCLAQVLKSGCEYSVDCFVNRPGIVQGICIRERRDVHDGQSRSGRVTIDDELEALCTVLVNVMPFRGVVNLQFIRDSEGPWLIDLNPRFPGGIAVTEHAGFPFCEWTIQALMD